MDNKTSYIEILKQITERDNISFKLLAFVPTVTGLLVFLTLWKEARGLPVLVFVIIGLLGAAITCFVWRWEMRNIQFCSILRNNAAEIELQYKRAGETISSPFADMGKAERPSFWGFRMGKTEAEKGLYIATIILWISLPLLANLIQVNDAAKTPKIEQTTIQPPKL